MPLKELEFKINSSMKKCAFNLPLHSCPIGHLSSDGNKTELQKMLRKILHDLLELKECCV